jgi:hypothetical protein
MGGGEGIRGERILGLRRREEQEEPDIFLLMFVCAGPPTECSTWAGICILEFFLRHCVRVLASDGSVAVRS